MGFLKRSVQVIRRIASIEENRRELAQGLWIEGEELVNLEHKRKASDEGRQGIMEREEA